MAKGVLIGVLAMVAIGVQAQVNRHFKAERLAEVNIIDLTVDAPGGKCVIRAGNGSDPVNIYGRCTEKGCQQQLVSEVHNNTHHINFKLSDSQQAGLSQKLFGAASQHEDIWKLYLTPDDPFNLSMHYGMGDAAIDLSGLSVKHLNVESGNANVKIGYHQARSNEVVMDSLKVDVDMGNVHFGRLNFARARHILANVGFGSLKMDFSGMPYLPSRIEASVGAGKLHIITPDSQMPVLIEVHDSMLCHVSLSKQFRKLENNVYVNEAYVANPDDAMVFVIDVAMGKIEFR